MNLEGFFKSKGYRDKGRVIETKKKIRKLAKRDRNYSSLKNRNADIRGSG